MKPYGIPRDWDIDAPKYASRAWKHIPTSRRRRLRRWWKKIARRQAREAEQHLTNSEEMV